LSHPATAAFISRCCVLRCVRGVADQQESKFSSNRVCPLLEVTQQSCVLSMSLSFR
jgi:hypothetical protein